MEAIMSRKYFFLEKGALADHLDAHITEVNYLLNTGILRRCNSIGTPSYRACDIAEARLAIEEAREKGQSLGRDIKEPAIAVKKATDEPEQMESVDALDNLAEVPEGEV